MKKMTPSKPIRDKKLAGASTDLKKERPRSVQELSNERSRQFPVERPHVRPATSGRPGGLVRSAKALFQDEELLDSGDGDVYSSAGQEAQRSVGIVVVDVHNENRESDRNSDACIPEERASDEIETQKSRKTRSGQLFEPKSTTDEDRSISRSARGNPERICGRENMREGLAWEIEESVDTFEELEESRSFNNSNSEENFPQSFGSAENFVSRSKENFKVEQEVGQQLIGEPKRRRKRWSKNKRNLHLTDELIANSSDINRTSAESGSHFSPGVKVKPVPAPRKKRYSESPAPESSSAYDNGAFRSDPEEVLCIETEFYEPRETSDGKQKYRQSTKIKMTNSYDPRKGELFDSDEHPGSWSGKDNDEIKKFSALKIANSNESETEIHEVEKTEDSQTLFTPIKSRRRSDAASIFETSEFSENETDGLESDACKTKEKNKRDSASLDTGNSLTNISDLPRGKSGKEHSQKSSRRKSNPKHSKKEENSKKDDPLQKRKSKRRNKLSAQNSQDDLIEYNADKTETFTSVTIHKADVLETDFITRHPMVKVHIVEINTGNYLKTVKSDNNVKCSYLQPMITGKFDFKENRSIVPNWEEELIFEYSFAEVVQVGDKPVIILFELLDLLNFAEASFNYNMLGSEGCWHKIAWAFLRPVGVSGVIHIDKKVRLQLYQPPKVFRKSGRSAKCEVFNWWRSVPRNKYPSTLYVTLKAIEPPTEDPILYDWLSWNELPEIIEDESCKSPKKCSDLLQLPKWTRLAAQSCKIPNNHLFESDTFENGCFYTAFSNNGKYLACVGSEEDNHPVVVYSIPEGKVCVQFSGHKNFVYSLNWSTDDKYLLSVSSDQTACIWDMENRIIQQIQMLPHPSFVYCGKFYPGSKHVVVTGCYDCVARVWTKSKRSKRYELTQELEGHKGFLSSLCFQKDGVLITADSVGTVMLWNLERKMNSSSAREWRFSKKIQNTETENVVINTIVLHPLGSRLLLHSRDNGLRMIDLETGIILQRYKGLKNRRLQTTACISPCGGLVLCGGEDCYLTVWNLENGRRMARYLIRGAKAAACVAYHPFDHILAFSTFGSASAVQMLNFDKSSTGENVGLDILSGNEDFYHDENMEIMMRFDKIDRGLGDLPRLNSRLNKGKSSRNSEVKYLFKKPGNLVKREETVDENSRSRRELLKLKIQRLHDSEEGLKSKSAARLNSIIEKIDKILVSTTLKRDFDSMSSSADVRTKDVSQISLKTERKSASKKMERRRSRSRRSRSRDKSSTPSTDGTTELHTGSVEFIELGKISSARIKQSENDVSSRNNESESNEDRFMSKSRGSESPRETSEENKFHEYSAAKVNVGRDRRPSRLSNKLGRKNEDCVIEFEGIKDSSASTLDSLGTYTISSKNAFSAKPSASDRSKSAETTSSSAKSSATFTIENEIIPTARKSVKKEPRRAKR